MNAEKIFQKIVLEHKIISKEQMEECLRLKRDATETKSLVVILIEKGYINARELSRVIELQRKYLKGKESSVPAPRSRRLKFGELCLQRGFLTPEKLRKALKIQARADREGHHYRIGQILTERGYITLKQAHEILELQGKSILRCKSCGSKFNIRNYRSNKKYRCPKCKAVLTSSSSDRPVSMMVDKGFLTREPVEVEDDVLALIGRRIGEYEVKELIGEGGMADVYKVENPYKRKVRAMKIMKSKAGVRRFTRELENARLLKHPNIVRVFENGEVDNRPYFLMEFIEGGTLAKRIQVTGALPLEQGLKILKQVAMGLQYANEHKIIHRDIKPSNILLTRFGREDMMAKITDFGIARSSSDSQITVTGQLLGTFKYMSPEHIKGLAIDGRNDIFSLGIVAYEIFTGREPFNVDAPVGYLFVNIKEEPPLITHMEPKLPKELAPLVAKMVAKEPQQRYDATSLLRDIERFERFLQTGDPPIEEHDQSSVYFGSRKLRPLKNITTMFNKLSQRLRMSDVEQAMQQEEKSEQQSSLVSSIYKLLNRQPDPETLASSVPEKLDYLAETEAIDLKAEMQQDFEYALQLEKKGNFQGAIKTLANMIERFPDTRWAQEAQQKIQELQQRLQMEDSSIQEAEHNNKRRATPRRREENADESRLSSSMVLESRRGTQKRRNLREAQELLVSVKAFIDRVKSIEEYEENELWLSDVFEQFKQVEWAHDVQEEVAEILYKWGRFLIDHQRQEEGVTRFWEVFYRFPQSRWYTPIYEELVTLARPPGMVFIEAGNFIRGEMINETEEYLDGFFLDIHPVTNAQYQEFLDSVAHPAPPYWEGGMYPVGKANHPVTEVSYEDAVAYAHWANKRLPTELEWEKAARGTEGRRWPWGNVYESKRCNCREAGIGDTTPVGQYPAGRSPFGCHDMAGNVWEWTASWYDLNLQNQRVLKGGSWFTFEEFTVCSFRNFDYPNNATKLYGIRCAKDFAQRAKRP